MSTESILYIILAGIIALLLALFQYWFSSKQKGKLWPIYTFLRFISIFSLLLLLINPKFEQTSYNNERPNLVIAIDDSESISYLNQNENANNLIESIKGDVALNERFNIDTYTFGSGLKTGDSTTYKEKRTNVSSSLRDLGQIYKNTTAPFLLISDGNQTYGSDYEFLSDDYDQPVFPVILGDTVVYADIRIQQLNVNRYAYLKNRFPVEVIITYNGNERINSRFMVTSGNSTIFSQPVTFSKTSNSQILNFNLPANQVGVQSYRAEVVPLNVEKNTVNNSKAFAVEVIDQKSNIAIVSDITHPDLGALKKAIESNEQRTVTFVKSNINVNRLEDFQLLILYQPNARFKTILDAIDTGSKNHFIITGTQTDWRFLESSLNYISKDKTNQTEEYQAILNTAYNTFIVDDLNFNSFPPLNSSFGDIEFSSLVEPILFKKIGTVNTESPLLATLEIGEQRQALLFGEGIWKWRAQSYLNNRSFNEFDNFIGKLVQYLASNKRRNRLRVNFDTFYDGSNPVKIAAQYFDQNYQFDNRGNLNIIVRDKISGVSSTLPFILNNNNYEVDLSNLPASEYAFTVSVADEGLRQSGSFTILDFNVEQQFLNADVTKLQRLATNTEGTAYFIADTDSLTTQLLNDKRFAVIQKSTKKIVPLIDWKYLLALIALSLAIEWFMRKYNGLI